MRAGLGGPGVCPCTGWGPGPPDDWREKVPCTDESGESGATEAHARPCWAAHPLPPRSCSSVFLSLPLP